MLWGLPRVRLKSEFVRRNLLGEHSLQASTCPILLSLGWIHQTLSSSLAPMPHPLHVSASVPI
jgi:hypothetical protein